MTILEQPRPTDETSAKTAPPGQGRPAAGSRRSAAVVRVDEAGAPLGDVPQRVRMGIGRWLGSPALDFYALIVLGALLLGTGLVMVLSSSTVVSIAGGASPFAGFLRQGLFALIGLPLLIAAALIPPRWYRRHATLLLFLGLALQALVFVPGLGYGTGGNRNWIRIGAATLQPSELLKLALAVWLGAVLSARHRQLNRFFVLLLCVLPGTVLAIGLVLGGKDLGTAMVMVMLVAGSLWVAGVPRRWFIGAGALAAVGVTVLTLTSANRMARIAAWLHGDCSQAGVCDQSSHGLMALAEGGWWGVGLGESRQKWGRLSEADNDFIFAIIGEELGLWGTLGVLALFTALALVMFRMITRLDDLFMQITVAGVASWLLGQAFTNMMVVTGILPVLGVPLPFISSGGSSLVGSMLALGMLLSFARREPGAHDAIRARIRRVRGEATVVSAAGPATPKTPARRRQAQRRAQHDAPRKTARKQQQARTRSQLSGTEQTRGRGSSGPARSRRSSRRTR